MNKAVFLDRDGTINIDKDYLFRIEDFEFIDGAVEGLRMLQDSGYLLVIITNQSGIARGYYALSDFEALNEYMLSELRKHGVNISGVYFCPHGPNDGCDCRKPKTGLFERAVRELDIDLSMSWAVGDKERDLSVCDGTSCRGLLIGRDVRSLLEAARIITGVDA